jgi:hypothetical protein
LRSFEQVLIPADGYEIVGYLSMGTDLDGSWVIFGHGNRQSGQNHELYQSLLHNLHREATVLAIDFRGFGRSSAEGLELADNIWDRSSDFDAAITYLKSTYHITDSQIVLMGHSLGAAQSLRASQGKRFRLVIPIGLGDYDTVLASDESMRRYGEKFLSNTGVFLEPEMVLREGRLLVPSSLFFPCPETPVVLLFGARDDRNSVMYTAGKVPADCEPPIRWSKIPLADHMYGTERGDLPPLVQRLYSTIVMSFLTWRVNQLLAE